MDLTGEQRLRFAEMQDRYKAIDEYMRKTKALNYVQFDYDTSHGLTLFTLDPDFDFEALERNADAVIAALPASKRIFSQPFIHLKEHDVILPVEAVRTVNNATVTHIATHSELWADVKNGEIKPEKLLTRAYEDNYGIYENLVFCDVVDMVLSFVRTNLRFLREFAYTNKTIEINLLERVNHLNYFLALGKLHIGYSKNFNRYYAYAMRCANKLLSIQNSILPRLKRPVYRRNRLRPFPVKLRKTNILSMHKEYHRIYKLAKLFEKHEPSMRAVTQSDICDLSERYFFFCRALCIFAIGNFGFACDEQKTFDFEKTLPRFTFKEWNVEIKCRKLKTPSIDITIKKDKIYKITLLPRIDGGTDRLAQKHSADEVLICSPLDANSKPDAQTILIDISDIDSFRRIQQIVLRGMIYADTEHKTCPFCGDGLTEIPNVAATGKPMYKCNSCHTEIYEAQCSQTGKPFYYTDITGLKYAAAADHWLAERSKEGAMHFRNITVINDENVPICPHCGLEHR
ncbi:MAG: hypothetical protein NC184_07650 [Roseburia sp.]|nr:hypothetical protein [Roseburia sp.]